MASWKRCRSKRRKLCLRCGNSLMDVCSPPVFIIKPAGMKFPATLQLESQYCQRWMTQCDWSDWAQATSQGPRLHEIVCMEAGPNFELSLTIRILTEARWDSRWARRQTSCSFS